MTRIASLVAVGLTFGLLVAGEPIKVPVLPAPGVEPKAVTPAGGPIPVIPQLPITPPTIIPLPLASPREVAPLPRSTQLALPISPPRSVSSPQPDFTLRVPASVLNVNPSAVVPAIPAQPATGVTTMPIRQLLMTAALGGALAASPVSAAPVGGPAPGALALKGAGEPKDDVKAELKKIQDDLKELQKSFKALSDAVNGTKEGAVGVDSGLLKRVTALESSFTLIDAALKRIETKLTEQKSTSGFAPPSPMPPAKAFVRIINEYPTEMSLLINGKSHRLQAGETKTVEVAAGNYTYELLHAGAVAKSSLVKENETVTLRIR